MDLTAFRTLSFDVYGTLIAWEAGIAAVLRPWAAEVGLAADDEALLTAYADNGRPSSGSGRRRSTRRCWPRRSGGRARPGATGARRDTARQKNDRAVVLMMQADMFDPTWPVTYDAVSAFEPLVQLIAAESADFDGEVYLVDGDSHVYHVDQRLAAGSSWLDMYSVTTPADNLTRVTVDGSANNWNWLEVTVAPRGSEPVLSWERVPYSD